MAGIIGSSGLQTSTANQEVVPAPPVDWKNCVYNFSKFSFYNDQACHVKINGDTTQIYLRAEQGFEYNNMNKPIKSFIIVESGITFNYVASY